jgi:MtN3 and saliva related transmembrane protein
MNDVIGWLSSAILVMTLAKQIATQWREGTSEGVSPWLFLGQIAASAGFILYSWRMKSWVFVVTNVLLVLNSLVGYALVIRQRRRGAHGKSQGGRGALSNTLRAQE